MKVNYLKIDSIETEQPIVLKFATYEVGYFFMHCADFVEYRSNDISTGTKGIILIHYC